MTYAEMLSLAKEHNYHSFTALQECAFQSSETYRQERDLFIVGETSSGKTLIPLLLYNAAVNRAAEVGKEHPKMLFVVPYRALAAQKFEEMQSFFDGKGLRIIQSTGEFRQDDEAIQNGNVDIAVVITEKVYKYEARNAEFLSKYDFLVLDEIGLISNADRGIRLDFILAWAKNQKSLTGSPRTIALGTPFFDWSPYIESYDFHVIRAECRPVPLEEVTVFYGNNGIEKVDGACSFLSRIRRVTPEEYATMEIRYGTPSSSCEHLQDAMCPLRLPCRSDRSKVCPATGKACSNLVEYVAHENKNTFRYILLEICREHLKQGHQILIFTNDRERVKQYCSFLYRELQEYLPGAPDAEECKKKLLEQCGLEGEDVFGILEHENDSMSEMEYYQAFMSGVAFHSAALPNELRTYVEKRLLESRELKIVCSTETLAFGVNSAVDVVIVADIFKNESSVTRPLSLNEYQNYAGRAGRLRPGVDASETKGYVYTLVKAGSKQRAAWEEIKNSISEPEQLFSCFHSDHGGEMPFFLLNLLPDVGTEAINVDEMVNMLYILPQDGYFTREILVDKVKRALKYLVDQGLAGRRSAVPMERQLQPSKDVDAPRYCLTELGKRLRGYIIGCSDYEKLLEALEEYVDALFLEPDKTTFLYRLLCTKRAEVGLNSIYGASDTRMELGEVQDYIAGYSHKTIDDMGWLRDCDNEKILSILAAMLAWSDGESAKMLYRIFGVHYALLSKLTEQVAYLIEITKEILPSRMNQIWKDKEVLYRKMKVDFESFSEAVDEKLKQVQNLFISIYYGVNTKIAQELQEFLADKEGEDPQAGSVAKALSLQHINPQTSRMLRRVIVRYKFFKNPPEVNMENIEERNNFRNQRRQYKKDIERMGPHISAFFKEKFGSDYTE